MATDFFRFPSTPHLFWLGATPPRDDKLLSASEAKLLLESELVIEEKLDGANLGISWSPEGDLRVQNRGQYLFPPYLGQFEKLSAWLAPREEALFDALGENLILFGEWCAARHSLDYLYLPDYLLVFDIYDRMQKAFWSSSRRNALAQTLALATVPQLKSGQMSKIALLQLLETHSSTYRPGPLEGLVLRKQNADWLELRAKIVKADFVQAIGEHWSRRTLEWNKIDWSAYTK